MPTDQNFNYHYVHDFYSNHDIIESLPGKSSFSALHCNIRSLSRNQVSLLHMLACLKFSFGLIESKIGIDVNPILNINIHGHHFNLFLNQLYQSRWSGILYSR